MRIVTTLVAAVRRLTRVLSRGRLDREIDDELAFHLAMREARLSESERDSARDPALDARRRFGNVTSIKEQTRDMWTFPSVESLIQDVRYALRSLRRAPAFTGVAVFALAIGIGANSAIFSLVNAVVLQGLPYPDAGRLVLLIGNVQRDAVERRGNSYPDHVDWRREATSFVDMAAYDTTTVTLSGGDAPQRVIAETVTSPYFSLVGAAPALGRAFGPAEDDPNAAPVVILSDGLWRSRFGADPGVIGRNVQLGTTPFEVIGVMPPDFSGITDTGTLWLPWRFGGYSPTGRGDRGFQTLARLKPGVTLAAATGEMKAVSARLAAAYPDSNEKRGVELISLSAYTFAAIQQPLTALMAAVVFVLLIACANVATLMVTRAEKRSREIALRTALGAGQRRLMRQLITESCVLAALAAMAGLALASAGLRVLVATSPVTLPSYLHPGLQWTVVAFTMAVTLGTGILLGLAPAIHTRISRLSEALKSASRGSSTAGSERLRRLLVVAEVALTVILLVGAGLMIRTSQHLSAVRTGFNPSGLLALNVGIPRLAPPTAAAGAPAPAASFAASATDLLDRVRALPGVTHAALVSDIPLGGNSSAVFYRAEGDSTAGAQKAPRAYRHAISPDFFATLEVPLKAGRTFTPADLTPDSTSVIVSEDMVRRFWPGESGVGKRIKLGTAAIDTPWLTIVGVVPELKYRGVPSNPTADPDMYFPVSDRSQLGIVLRSSQSLQSLEGPVRRAVQSAGAGVVVFNMTPVEELVRQQTSRSRFTTWLLGVFAAAALVLAVVGLYGMMSYTVDQRSREFGIRVALGASRAMVVRLVLGDGARMIAIGLAIGTVAAWQMSRAISAELFEVTPYDSAAGLAIVGLAVTALLACAVPALRATRVDPARSLRNE